MLFALAAGLTLAVAGCARAEVSSPPATAPTAPVTAMSLLIRPSADNLLIGDHQQLIAVLKDRVGQPLTGRAISWATRNPEIATVSSTGIVTGHAPGIAHIIATSGGRSGTTVITIWAPRTDTTECDAPRPGWVWCDDFEKDRLSSYFEYGAHNGDFVRLPGVGYGGSTGMRARFSRGQVQGGFLHLAIGKTPWPYLRPADAGTAVYREIYWRHFVKLQMGWIGGGGNKLSRAQAIVNRGWAQAMMAHVWSGIISDGEPYRLGILPASGTDPSGVVRTTSYNDFPHFRWLGTAWSRTPIFDAMHVGKWYCVEAHARLNDAGRSNGVFELWINDALEARIDALNWQGAYSEYGINTVFLENYWNEGAPQPQERYFDNFVVSTQRIGC